MDRITGSGCEVCRGAVPSGKESAGHTGLCAQVLSDALAAERARAHDAINQLDKETAYSGVLKAALDRVALVLHPDKSPDENWTYSTGDLPVMACDLRARAERAEARLAKLEAVAEAARTAHARIAHGVERQSAALVCGDLRASDDAIEEIDSARMVLCDALAALEGGE